MAITATWVDIYLDLAGDDWGMRVLVGDDREAAFDKILDVDLRDADGRRFTGTVATLPQIQECMTRWTATGEALSGAYFGCPDLVIVAEMTEEALGRVFDHLVRTGEYRWMMDEVTDIDAAPLEPD